MVANQDLVDHNSLNRSMRHHSQTWAFDGISVLPVLTVQHRSTRTPNATEHGIQQEMWYRVNRSREITPVSTKRCHRGRLHLCSGRARASV